MIVIFGVIAMLLDREGLRETPVRLGKYLAIPIPDSLVDLPPLVQLTVLVGVLLSMASLFALTIWLHRRGADTRARAVTMKLHRDIFDQSMRRAEIEGAIAQRSRAQVLLEQRMPQLAKGLSAWWRSMPRSLLMMIGCLTVALLVNIPLASLAVISGLLLWQLYRALRRSIDSESNVWETPRSRRRLVNLVSQAPLLARAQIGGPSDQSFNHELEQMFGRLQQQQYFRGRLWPIMTLASSVAVSLLVLGLGVNLLNSTSGLSLPAAMVLGLSLAGAVAGATRLIEAMTASVAADEAAHGVYQYMQTGDDAPPSEQRVGMAGLRDKVEFFDVSLGDLGGSAVLSNVSLQLRPGTLVALMGTSNVSTHSLAELILGIGRPGHGRIAVDGISLQDIHPRALVKNVLWVGSDGPISEGTVFENITAGHTNVDSHDVMRVTQQLGIYDSLTRLSDGLQTVLSANDNRLTAESKYSIGIARAMLHKPSIIVVDEPEPAPEELATDHCFAALRKLVADRSLVLIMPRRINTLRLVDRVLLLNGDKLAGEGKHNDLLQSSDLYRHLNYLLFNPYRDRS